MYCLGFVTSYLPVHDREVDALKDQHLGLLTVFPHPSEPRLQQLLWLGTPGPGCPSQFGQQLLKEDILWIGRTKQIFALVLAGQLSGV